jgi:hypothetical protein
MPLRGFAGFFRYAFFCAVAPVNGAFPEVNAIFLMLFSGQRTFPGVRALIL